MSKKLFISSGFDQVNLSWIIPIIVKFTKLRKIDTIVFESKLDLDLINKNPKLRKILKNYNKIFFKKNYLIIIFYFFLNFFKISRLINLILKKQIIINKNSEDTQILHSIWDSAKLNLLEKEYEATKLTNILLLKYSINILCF